MKITFIKTGKRLKEKTKKISKQKENKKDKPNVKNKLSVFKDIIKKNQIVVLTLALMLITAGYMNYNNENSENLSLAEIGDARLVSTNITDENLSQENNISENKVQENVRNETKEENIISNETNEENKNETNKENIAYEENIVKETNATQSDYFEKTRLERETMYSQMLEAYQKILENDKIPTDQKSVASNEIKNINDRINAISIAENLIKTKGFEDIILLINDNSVNVVVKAKENLKEEEIAQITNVVSRELKAEIENIHISIHD